MIPSVTAAAAAAVALRQHAVLRTSRTSPGYCHSPDALILLFSSLPPSQSLETIFEMLEKKASLLLSAWKPLWRAHCIAKGLRVKVAGGGADGEGRDTVASGAAAPKHGLPRHAMDSRLATKRRRAGGGRGGEASNLGEMVLKMMRSVAGAGIDIEVYAAASYMCIQTNSSVPDTLGSYFSGYCFLRTLIHI